MYGRTPARLATMAKPKNPRIPGHRRPADLALPLDGSVALSANTTGQLDTEPLLIALRVGLLDDHLEQIAKLVNQRFAAVNAADELIAARRLHVGDHVRLGHNLKPQYIHGKMVTIIAQEGDKWVVRLDEPVGRFTNADLRVSAIQLEPT